MGTVSVQLGLLAIAKDRANADLGDLETAAERATSAGHRVLLREVVGDSEAAIRIMLERWIADPTIDVIIVLGGSDSDAVSNAIRPLVAHVLPGFTDLFRFLFFQQAGASAMLSAAEAARCKDTFVFVLPGAVGDAMDQLILPQFDPTTTPKNLVGQMPRLRAERDNAPVATADEASAGHGVPREVTPEKTEGGSGVPARLPAMAAPKREQKRTGANVIVRNAPSPPKETGGFADLPTKPIDLERLEAEIAASQTKDDVTRRTDLQKLLPRVPPGADDIDDDDGDVGDVTHADIIAAPPAKPFTVPAIPKPAAAPIARITPVPAKAIPSIKPLPSITKTASAVDPKALDEAAAAQDAKTTIRAIDEKALDAKAAAKPAMNTVEARKTPEVKAPEVKPDVKPSAPVRPTPNPIAGPGPFATTGAPAPLGPFATARPNVATPPAGVSTPDAIEPTPGPVTIQPRKREDKANGSAKRLDTEDHALHATDFATPPSGTNIAALARAAADEAPTIARSDEAKTTVQDVEEAKTQARPAVNPRASGAFGVLSDSDIEPVDTDNEGEDLDAIRAAATAQSDEAPTVSRAEPVRVKQPTTPPVTMVTAVPPAPAPAPPRTRPPTAPPTKTTAPAPTSTPASTSERERPATTPPPPRTTSELPRGTFNYPVQRRGMHWAVKVLLVLVVLGAGFGGFVFFFRDKLAGESNGSGEGSNPIATAAIDAAVIATAEIDAAVVEPDAAEEPEIEINDPPPTQTGSAKPTGTKPPRGDKPRGEKHPTTTPKEDGSAASTASVDAGVALPTPPTGPSNTPPGAGDSDCDETACVLANYDKPCCAKFKPASTGDVATRAGGVPETLDKSMVRAGVNGVKPKVQRCGEKIAVKGTVKVSMTVSPDGAVTDASLADSPDPSLGECVVAAMKLAKFGKSVNGASFTYPFIF